MYAPFGVVEKPDASLLPPGDAGRFMVTKAVGDKFVFKVPTLRNIALTAPYFHTGKIERLDRAVAIMSEYQTGRPLSEAEIQSVTAWLRTLTGEIPAQYIAKPALPRSTALTPAPDRS